MQGVFSKLRRAHGEWDTHEICRCGSDTVYSIDYPVLRIEDIFERCPCKATCRLVIFEGKEERSIPRASFCLTSVIDPSGSASTSTSQSVANAEALDMT